MTIVIDASIALKWVLEEPESDAAEELPEKDLAAPSLWLPDAGNALWRRMVRGELMAAEAVERLTELTKAPVASVPMEQDLPEAMSLALQLYRPVYDCLPGARKAPGDLCRHRRHALRPSGGRPWGAYRAYSGLVADNPWYGPMSVAAYEQVGASTQLSPEIVRMQNAANTKSQRITPSRGQYAGAQ